MAQSKLPPTLPNDICKQIEKDMIDYFSVPHMSVVVKNCLEWRDQSRGMFEVLINIGDVDLERLRQPFSILRTEDVVTAAGRQIDQRIADLHPRHHRTRPRQPRAGTLAKAEHPLQPFDGTQHIVVRE